MTDPAGAGVAELLVVVGASAGGVVALRELVALLPSDLGACVCVAVHLPPTAVSVLPEILDRAGALTVRAAANDDVTAPNTVLVAPSDHHLVVRAGYVRLGRGPRENRHRPSVDVLFRSASRWWGPRVIAVVLSGSLDDGAAGLHTVHERGGAAFVQDPGTALFSGMPSAALAAVPEAGVAPIPELAELIVAACRERIARPAPSVTRALEVETSLAEMDEDAMTDPDRPGTPAGLACPDCHGAMFEIREGSMVRYRCRVGHAYSPQTLMAEQMEAVESALWMAVRTLEEKAALHRRLADAVSGRLRHRHTECAEDADRSAATIRRLIRGTELPGGKIESTDALDGPVHSASGIP